MYELDLSIEQHLVSSACEIDLQDSYSALPHKCGDNQKKPLAPLTFRKYLGGARFLYTLSASSAIVFFPRFLRLSRSPRKYIDGIF